MQRNLGLVTAVQGLWASAGALQAAASTFLQIPTWMLQAGQVMGDDIPAIYDFLISKTFSSTSFPSPFYDFELLPIFLQPGVLFL